MKTINCREAGFDCDHIVKGETEEDVMKKMLWRCCSERIKDHFTLDINVFQVPRLRLL